MKKGDELAFFHNSSCIKKLLINLREELIEESRELTDSEQNQGNVTDSKYQIEAGSTNMRSTARHTPGADAPTG